MESHDDDWFDDPYALDAEGLEECRLEAVRGEVPLYHVTWRSRLESIRQEGLVVGGGRKRGNRWIGGADTRDRCRGRVFLTGEDRIDHWATQMAENLEPPRRGDSLVVIEFDVSGLPLELDHEYPGDYILGRDLPPDRIVAVLADDPWLADLDAWLVLRAQAWRSGRPAPTRALGAPRPARRSPPPPKRGRGR